MIGFKCIQIQMTEKEVIHKTLKQNNKYNDDSVVKRFKWKQKISKV